MNYSLQGARKSLEGASHPDREAQQGIIEVWPKYVFFIFLSRKGFNTKFSKRFNLHFMHDKRIGIIP